MFKNAKVISVALVLKLSEAEKKALVDVTS